MQINPFFYQLSFTRFTLLVLWTFIHIFWFSWYSLVGYTIDLGAERRESIPSVGLSQGS